MAITHHRRCKINHIQHHEKEKRVKITLSPFIFLSQLHKGKENEYPRLQFSHTTNTFDTQTYKKDSHLKWLSFYI